MIRMFLLVASVLVFYLEGIAAEPGCGQNQPPAVTTMTKKSITVARGRFSYREGGNASGEAVVMVHGWPESSYCWEGVAANLNKNLRVIAPDLRGLGDSVRTLDVSAYQKVELAKDIVAILDRLGITSFYLVGHDWGGIVAQEIAFLIPDRVKKIAIINIPVLTNAAASKDVSAYMASIGFKPYWYQYFQQQENLPETMITGNERVWVEHFFGEKGKDGTIPKEAIDEYVRCYQIRNTPATAANLYRTMTEDYKHWATLSGKFAMPGLYIYGNQDTVITRANTTHLEDCFDSIKVEELEAAHFVMDEKPKEVAGLLNNFLN